ncbi:MAG: hypothetical protein AAF821_19830 [Cyanobacteria bacterium P01_D01_bin.156]
MKRMIAAYGFLMVTVLGLSANAQSNGTGQNGCVATTPAEQLALNAAKNEARQMAELSNGGLEVYRAEPAMHGASIDAPCEMLGPATWRFMIRGGEPTAVVLTETYTTLSIVTVEGIGRDRTVTLDYNGPINNQVR